MNDPKAGMKILEAALGLSVSIGIALALADTPLYPVAFGMLTVAFLYLALETNFVTTVMYWLSKSLKAA